MPDPTTTAARPVPPLFVEGVCGVEECEAPMSWTDDGKEVCSVCGWAP